MGDIEEGRRVLTVSDDAPCAVIYTERTDEGLVIREERVFA